MTRRATIRTAVARPETVAAAVAPDNTAEMTTTVADGRVVTRIERETTGGLRSTVDDYVVNVDVATDVVETAEEYSTPTDADTEPDTHDT